MDAPLAANSGHQGTAMSLAPLAHVLYSRVMTHDPARPDWFNRDRLILSNGHASILQYSMLYLSGYGLEMDDLRSFRQWGSATPGHPETGHTKGVEVTTGPLGQGVATAVGMAMASRYQRGLLDPDAPWGFSPFDHHVWVFASDGDLEEGISGEASSLAGVQRLGNLTVVWDDNHISIEGDTAVAFSEDVAARYAAYGWAVHRVGMAPDGDIDIPGLAAALQAARLEQDRPTFIQLRTVIAWPAPHARNTGKAHGAALGAPEVAATKTALGLDPARDFEVASDVLAHARGVGERGADIHAEWNARYDAWRVAHPDRAQLLDRLLARQLPEQLPAALPVFESGTSIATRAASGTVINAIAAVMPEFWGGSADLAESNNTTIEGGLSFLPAGVAVKDSSPYGRILHFGIREHAMGAILNGIALEGLTRPFGGTFLVFSDYMRGAVRLAALSRSKCVFVWTHDSVGVGAYFATPLRDAGFRCVPVNVGMAPYSRERFVNLKAELYWSLRERFARGEVAGLRDERAIAQLASIQYDHDSSGRTRIESKDAMRKRALKSPDRAEAVMLAFAASRALQSATVRSQIAI